MSNTQTFADWMVIQLIAALISVLVLSKVQSQKIRLVLLGSIFHGSLSIAFFGLWSQYIRPFL